MLNIHQTVFGCISYCLVRDKKQIKDVAKRFGIKAKDIGKADKGGGMVSFFDTKKHGRIAIVHLPKSNNTLSFDLCVLVHEAVHIKQQLMEMINEDKPSIEFEAYVVDNIAYYLIEDYLNKQSA